MQRITFIGAPFRCIFSAIKILLVDFFLAVLGLRWGSRTSSILHRGLVVSFELFVVACGILVPRPGIEPTSPALEGGFSATEPPGWGGGGVL